MKEQKKEPEISWNEAITLDEWVERMIRQDYTAIVIAMMNTLPENRREHYREIWRRVKAEKKP